MGKNGIKSKLLKKITAAIAVSTIMSGVVLGFFFINEIRKQVYDRDVNSVNQIADQLNTIANDIRSYAINIVTDPSIQETAMNAPDADIFSSLSEIYHYSLRLKDYQNLRSYIQSVVVITKDGNSYWSIQPYYNDHVFDEYMTMDWYQKVEGRSGVFGEPYEIQTNIGRGMETVFSYVMDFRQKEDPSEVIGQIVLNIRLSEMQEILSQHGVSYDEFLCCTEGGTLIFSSEGSMQDAMLEAGIAPETDTDARFVVNNTIDFGWTIVSYMSNFSLFQKINFTLYAFAIVVIVSVVCVAARFLMRRTIRGIVDPISELTDAIHRVSDGALDTQITIHTGDEIERMSDDFNKMVSNLRKSIAKSIEDEKIKKRLEFELLISQINPHFIYNTLNTIIYLARKSGNTDIIAITVALIQILQNSIRLDEGGDTLIPLATELQSVKDYLLIQRYRFGNLFSVIWKIEDGLDRVLLPEKAVQILVENALVHGILEKGTDGTILIQAQKENTNLILCVEDNGVGMSEEKISEVLSSVKKPSTDRISVGIFNIRERIKYLYHIENALKIESVIKKYTKVTIKIPILYKISKNKNKNDEMLH